MHLRDRYVAEIVLEMSSPDGRTRRAISPPRLELLPRGLTPLNRARGMKDLRMSPSSRNADNNGFASGLEALNNLGCNFSRCILLRELMSLLAGSKRRRKTDQTRLSTTVFVLPTFVYSFLFIFVCASPVSVVLEIGHTQLESVL